MARFFARISVHIVVRVQANTVVNGHRLVAIKFDNGDGITGEVFEVKDFMMQHRRMAAEIGGEGSVHANAYKLSQGIPL